MVEHRKDDELHVVCFLYWNLQYYKECICKGSALVDVTVDSWHFIDIAIVGIEATRNESMSCSHIAMKTTSNFRIKIQSHKQTNQP